MDIEDFSAEEEGLAEDYLGPSVLEKLAQGLDNLSTEETEVETGAETDEDAS